MMAASSIVVVALLAAAGEAQPASEAQPAERQLLVATAVEPLRVDKLADALRIYVDAGRVEVRTAPAATGGELRADVAAALQTVGDQQATAVLRIAPATPESIEIALSAPRLDRTIITSIPRSVRDEDLYRTLALKVPGLLHAVEDEPVAAPAVAAAAEPVPPANPRVDLQAGVTVATFPLGDVTQEGVLLRGRWAMTETIRVGVGARLLPELQRKSGTSDVRMRAVPLVAGIERFWRGSRFELAAGLLVLAEPRRAVATAGKSERSDWAFVAGGGLSLSFGVRLARAVRLSLQGAAIGLPWSDRYRIGDATVFDATRLEVPVDLTLDVAM